MPDAEGRFIAAIVGSSDFYPDDDVFAVIERLRLRHPEGLMVLTPGTGKGVPKVVSDTARMVGLAIEEEAPLDEDSISDLNSRIVARADTLVAFFHPGPTNDLSLTSSGTVNAFRQAQGRRIPTYAFHEGKWYQDLPRAPTLPPDGWTVPRGYKADDHTGHCGSARRAGCGGEILWAENPRGRRTPLNRDGSSHITTCPARPREAARA